MRATALLLALVVPGVVAASVAAVAAPPRPTPVAEAPASAGIRVYYFHGTTRCANCKTIEAYAPDTVATAFTPELKAGSLEWTVVNVDEPANQHSSRATSSSTRVRWWSWTRRTRSASRCSTGCGMLVGDKAAFQKYVEQEIRAFPRS